MTDIKEGDVFEVEYPFVKEPDPEHDFLDGPWDPWKPGIEHLMCAPDDVEAFADALGKMVLTVIGVYKPGKYPTRIFFTRKWVSPSGKEFGKGGLKIATTPKFNRLRSGYGFDYIKPDETKYEGKWGL